MDDWRPESLRDAPFFRSKEGEAPKTPEQVRAELENAGKFMGDLAESHIKIPGSDDQEALTVAQRKAMEKIPGLTVIPDGSDPEAQAEFFKSIGRPETADQYTVPEGVEDSDALNPIREAALKDGWTQGQFESFVNRVAGEREQGNEALQSQLAENQATLKAEWGAAFDERTSQVGELLSSEGVPQAIKDSFTEGRLSPQEMMWLHSIADAVSGEDVQIRGQRSASDKLTPGEAAEQLTVVEQQLYSMKNTNPNYGAMIAKQERLLRAMNAGQG